MSKDTKIISDLRSFFAKNDDNRAIKCIMGVMEHINIRSSQIGVEKKENCKFTTLQVLNLLMLFPFFVVKNASRYSNSSLRKLFNLCHLMGEPQETRPSSGWTTSRLLSFRNGLSTALLVQATTPLSGVWQARTSTTQICRRLRLLI